MNNLKCPFCNKELVHKNINDRMCSNEKCVSWKGNFYGSEDLWQELIRTRKALEIAVDALTRIIHDETIIHGCTMIQISQKALEQITALEQKDVK